VQQHPPAMQRGRPADAVGSGPEELGKHERLLLQPQRVVIAREQVAQLIAEHDQAAGLHADQWDAGADLGPQGVEDLPQLTLGQPQHAVVVQRAAAAQHSGREPYVVAAASRISTVAWPASGWK